MILKLLLILLIVYGLYKLLGGEIALPKKKHNKVNSEDDNTLLECSKCHVYITKKEAIIKKGKIFCDECAKEK